MASNWIPVSEGLPTDDDQVLVSVQVKGSNHRWVEAFEYYKGVFTKPGGREIDWYNWEPTHWMQLPPPPAP